MQFARERELLTALRLYEEQAAFAKAAYGSAMAADGMLRWIATAARELREAQDRKMVHVGASANVDQSTIYRFESQVSWPREIDRIVAGYADDLEIRAVDIWRRALELWDEDGDAATREDDDPEDGGTPGVVGGAAAGLLKGSASPPRKARGRRLNQPGAPRRKTS